MLRVADASVADRTGGGLPRADHRATLQVWNKCDLVGPGRLAGRPGVAVSAHSGDGLEKLQARIVGCLVPESPPPGAPVPFETRHVQLLEAAVKALAQGDTPAALGSLAPLADP